MCSCVTLFSLLVLSNRLEPTAGGAKSFWPCLQPLNSEITYPVSAIITLLLVKLVSPSVPVQYLSFLFHVSVLLRRSTESRQSARRRETQVRNDDQGQSTLLSRFEGESPWKVPQSKSNLQSRIYLYFYLFMYFS